jgi:hypothetical protein
MLNLFSTNSPNRIAVRTSAFIRHHDPIRRFVYGKHGSELMPNAPYWFRRFFDDFITAIPRQCYEDGIVTTIRDLTEGMYAPVIADMQHCTPIMASFSTLRLPAPRIASAPPPSMQSTKPSSRRASQCRPM